MPADNPEFVSYLLEIAKNSAQILYYVAASTKAWYNIATFFESNMFLLTAGAGALVGYLLGRSK